MRTFVTHQFSLLMFCTNLTVNNGDGRCSLPFQWFHLSTILPILGFYLKMYQLYDFTLIFFYGSAWRFLSKSFNDSTILSILLTLWLHCKSSSLSSRQNMSFYCTRLKSRYILNFIQKITSTILNFSGLGAICYNVLELF